MRLRLQSCLQAANAPLSPAKLARLPSYQLGCRSAWSVAASTSSSYRLVADNESSLRKLAEALAQVVRPGDCYLLSGHVGAGKTTFCRAFIRAVDGDALLEVPSPTYVLEYVYDEHEGPDIHHIDLYRLREPGEAARLDIAGTLQTAAALIEWPERLGSNSLPTEHLAIHLQSPEQPANDAVHASDDIDDEANAQEPRTVTLIPSSESWAQRLKKLVTSVILPEADGRHTS